MLLIGGPNVMRGYMGRQDLTDEVIRDGWYVTGDMASIDADGFIFITGRQSRFSKIGGEMVPHIRVEEELVRLLGEANGETDAELGADDSPLLVVTSASDTRKGERLIVLHRKIPLTPEQMRAGLSAAGLPNLYLPAADAFFEVEAIPLLGSGKLDLKAVQEMACEVSTARPVKRLNRNPKLKQLSSARRRFVVPAHERSRPVHLAGQIRTGAASDSDDGCREIFACRGLDLLQIQSQIRIPAGLCSDAWEICEMKRAVSTKLWSAVFPIIKDKVRAIRSAQNYRIG